MTEKIIVIGAIGSAKVIGEQIHDAYSNRNGDQEFIGYAFDDKSYDQVNDFPVICGTRDVVEKFKNDPSVKFIFQMYRPDKIAERVEWRNRLRIPEDKWATFVHPLSYVASSAKVGYGSVILSSSTVNANANVGTHCTLQAGCTIGHDAEVGNNNFFATQSVIGNCIVGDNNFFGLNSNTNNFIKIGSDCFVAMGSNVVKGIEDGLMVKGNPAKVFKSHIRRM